MFNLTGNFSATFLLRRHTCIICNRAVQAALQPVLTQYHTRTKRTPLKHPSPQATCVLVQLLHSYRHSCSWCPGTQAAQLHQQLTPAWISCRNLDKNIYIMQKTQLHSSIIFISYHHFQLPCSCLYLWLLYLIGASSNMREVESYLASFCVVAKLEVIVG